MQQITEQVCEFQKLNLRIILLGDFNIDQNVDEHFDRFDHFKQEFSMEQNSKFATHIDGGILDLIFDTMAPYTIFGSFHVILYHLKQLIYI